MLAALALLAADCVVLAWSATAATPLADTGLILAALLVAALALGPALPKQTLAAVLAGAAVGLIVFVRVFGTAVLQPGYTEWLDGDLAQHWLGWEFFRRDAWRWPPGANALLAHPVGTSLVYTDSMPLFGLLLKPLQPWLPAQAQYVGLVVLSGYAGQGASAAWLARRAGLGSAAAVLAALLFVQLPALLLRGGHDTLTWQWLILAGLALYLRANRGEAPDARVPSRSWPWPAWYLLLGIAALVHPYLAVMLLSLLVLAAWQAAATGNQPARRSVALVAGAVGLLLACWYLAGAFVLVSVGDLAGVEWGTYSANLLWPLDGAGVSRWLPALPLADPGQWEGRAWPGLGAWLLVLAAAALALRDRGRRLLLAGATRRLLVLVVIAQLVAYGGLLTLAGQELLDLSTLVPRPLESFHATGRFVWLVLYGILALCLLRLSTHPRLAVALLLAAVALQTLELRPWTAAHRLGVATASGTGLAPLRTPALEALAADRRHLVAVPARHCGEPPADWQTLARLALAHGLSSNSAYLARFDGDAIRTHCASVAAELRAGQWRADTLYVFRPDTVPESRPGFVECVQADSIVACASR